MLCPSGNDRREGLLRPWRGQEAASQAHPTEPQPSLHPAYRWKKEERMCTSIPNIIGMRVATGRDARTNRSSRENQIPRKQSQGWPMTD